MKVEIVEVKEDEKEILLNLIEKYLYEFSQDKVLNKSLFFFCLKLFWLIMTGGKMADAQKIREEFAKIVPDYQYVLQFQADGELIVNDIEKKIGSSKKALILGSYWEHQLAKKTDTFFVSLSMPVLNEVVTNGSYAGYSGGLHLFKLSEELYCHRL